MTVLLVIAVGVAVVAIVALDARRYEHGKRASRGLDEERARRVRQEWDR